MLFLGMRSKEPEGHNIETGRMIFFKKNNTSCSAKNSVFVKIFYPKLSENFKDFRDFIILSKESGNYIRFFHLLLNIMNLIP